MVVLTEILPGSTSSDNHTYKYEVFLSFRGADTRYGFTDHLYDTLLNSGIITFLDDEEIETGEQLKPELEGAIRSSRASVIVLSENYASSTWCLDELALILEQKRNFKQLVIPIFYHVEPTDVRKQQNSFGEAMAKHKQRMETETNAEKINMWAQKMELWKSALTEVAGLKGMDANNKKETKLIEEVVTNIYSGLGAPLSNTLTPLIGMDYEIRLISSWLTDGYCHTSNILTLVGIGGIGKTFLAEYVFRLHSRRFLKSSFIKDIDRGCKENFNGLLDFQKKLHGDITKKTPSRNDVSMYTSMIETALEKTKVFIVLDDIGSVEQLDALLGNKMLHTKSKIIITTRDASLSERCALFDLAVQPNHREVSLNGLSEFKSLELLCINAFKSNNPKEGFNKVSEKIVKYCEGHPLALQVLGKSLHKRDVAYWEDTIKELKEEPHSHVKNALKMSIDSLPSKNNKELFKHIACFFVGMDRDVTETILNACNIKTRSGITNLIDRCLLSIGWNNELMMHKLVQQMGRELVRQESPEKPWKRSRLWCHEESFKVLKQKKGMGNLLGFALDMRMLDKKKLHGSCELKTKPFCHMDKLMLLQLNYVQLKGCFANFPQELRWLCMHGSPLKSIPLDLPMKNLVALDLSYSNIEVFDISCGNPQPPAKRQKLVESCSTHTQLLGSLKILDLSFCEQLQSIGGFLELPALERLIVKNCISLIEVCESVEQCIELVHIDLSYCYKLRMFPTSIGKLKKVKTLLLDGCSSSESKINTIQNDLKLTTLSLSSSLRVLSLANNNLSNESFPRDFSRLSMLEELCLNSNPIVSLPNCVTSLPRLQKLSMNRCEKVKSIENLPRTLRELSIISYKSHTRPLRKIKFDPEMSPITLDGTTNLISDSSLEIDGIVKIQAMTDVEEKVLRCLGWTNLDFIKERLLRTYIYGSGSTNCKTQMYYEFGIFSIFYLGDEIPNWISCRSQGRSISFIIPSSHSKLRGLNLCFTFETFPKQDFCDVPMIQISNITKNHTWIYDHFIEEVGIGEMCCLSYLSHWMFGPNEMKSGDHITITLAHRYSDMQVTKECGIGLVYDESSIEEEQDVLGYYKSWNHIIGGDLSAFQTTTGEYILDNNQFNRRSDGPHGFYPSFIEIGTNFKEERLRFKAFSEKNWCQDMME